MSPATPMEFNCRRVSLGQIDSGNLAYRIKTGDTSDILKPSIRSGGVVNPPVLIPQGSYFQIVTGFSRIKACRRLGIEAISCHLLPANAESVQCAKIAVIDNAMQRDLNLMEQANAIGLLARFQSGIAPIGQAARECGIPVHDTMVAKLLTVRQMPPQWQEALAVGDIALPIALQLHAMPDKEDAQALVQLLLDLNFGLNRQREILDWIVGIARREGRSIDDVVNSDDLRDIRCSADLDRKQRGQAIRRILEKLRFPQIVRYQSRYDQAVKSLKLTKGTHLIAPSNFEGQTYSLKFDFQDLSELRAKLVDFRRIVDSQSIQGLWADNSSRDPDQTERHPESDINNSE